MRYDLATPWQYLGAWERIAAGAVPAVLEQEAVPLLPGEQHQAINRHVLIAGDRDRLMNSAEEFFLMIRKWCGFGSMHDWGRQRAWLGTLFPTFFSTDCHVGWASLTTERRPGHLRPMHDFRVTISDDPGLASPISMFDASDLARARPIHLFPGGRRLAIPSAGLHLHHGGVAERAARGRVFLIHSPRTVSAPALGLANYSYCEFWACLGLPGRDEGDLQRLARREIPAVALDQYRTGKGRLRVNPMLSLFKIDLCRGQTTYFGVEVHRESGGVLDIRTTQAPLDATVLMASLAERTGIGRMLLDVNRPLTTGPLPMPSQPRGVPSAACLRYHAVLGQPLLPVREPDPRPVPAPDVAQLYSVIEAWVKNGWAKLSFDPHVPANNRQSHGYFEVLPTVLSGQGGDVPDLHSELEQEIASGMAKMVVIGYGDEEVGSSVSVNGCRVRIIYYRSKSPLEADPKYTVALERIEKAINVVGHVAESMMTKLQFFWAICEEQSFSGAGKRLYPGDLTRAAQVKERVRELASELDLDLVETSPKTKAFVRLTEGGAALQEYLNQRIDLHSRLSALGPTRTRPRRGT